MAIIPFLKETKLCCGTKKSHIVLPVCPKENFRIRFDAERKMGRAIPLNGALTWLKELHQQGTVIKSIEIAGPGDPLAEPELTIEMAQNIAQYYPNIQVGIKTIGLHAEKHATEIAKSGVTTVTLLVEAVDPEISQKIYAWIRPAQKTLLLKQGSKLLLEEQSRALKIFKEKGLHVSIETVIYPSVNDEHVEAIAQTMASHGADTMTLIPYKQVVSDDNKTPETADKRLMRTLLGKISSYFRTVSICNHKSSELGSPCDPLATSCVPHGVMLPKPSADKPNVAVVSSNGMEIDLHLGQAYQVLIYGPREDGLPCLLGTRSVPEPGRGSSRWEELADSLKDCFAMLTASAGDSPRKILGQHGITILINEGEIEGTVDVLFGGGKKGKKKC